MSNPFLEWLDEKQRACRLEIIDRVFIGRVCKGIDETRRIIVNDLAVSRDHAEIIRRGSRLQIKDVSKNGTWVNGVRLAGGSTEYLDDGDVIRLGETSLFVGYPGGLPFREDSDISSLHTAITPKEVIVTNVVADVRGFTSMSQAEDSHQIYTLMKEIFQRFSGIVNDHKGTIKDYAGDAIYAFWEHGVSLSKEQAMLACQNALAQAEAVAGIRDELRSTNPVAEHLRMGWGVTTGSVTLSHYGSRVSNLALVGDCTNLAFRLSGIANKELEKKIIVCAHTADLVRDSLALDDLGEVSVRGRKGELHVFGL
ncbi:MAG: adenylate/guanylate cyclase domain-containing protein [Deltaproteobacteria bacterium]|nr:adenylate/guanylate cyclase domain-containing protein [Deltaproteobacteria bacterium]